jgi:hypothetical protein
MKKKITVTGIFNDFFTNYKDQESSISFILDDIKDCRCGIERCIIHNPPKNYIISDSE